MSFRAALWSTPYGWVKPGLGVSPNSGPPVGGIALMSPQGFFGDTTSALLPATARSGANGNWFFGYKGKSRASPQPVDYWSKEEVIRRGLDKRLKKRSKKRSKFGNKNSDFIGRMSGAKQQKPSLRERRASILRRKRLANAAQLMRMRPSFGGTNSDSLSGMVKPGPPNMRTFPMLGAYPGEVGPGNTPGGTAYNGSFVGPENPLMSYYFTYGRRRSARRKAHRSVRRSSRRKARRSVRRSMRRC
jgi:hypothetical protein